MIRDFISRHKFAVGFLCGLLAIPIVLAGLWFFAFGKQMIVWQSYEFTIPKTESSLIFKWQAIHPFLAEYDRKIQVVSKNHKSPEYWLLTNTGGRHHLNLYITEIDNEKWIRVLDEFSECVINLDTLQGFNIGRKFGKTFVAPPAKMAYWGYSWENNKIENLQAFTGSIKGIYPPRFQKIGQFIGSLDARSGVLRFIPASEKPEEHIRTMEEQADEMFDFIAGRVKGNLPESFLFVNPNTEMYYSENSVRRVWDAVRNKAGISKSFRLYDATRHSLASHSGSTLFAVSRLLGHSSVKMTEKYAHANIESLRVDLSKVSLATVTNLSLDGKVKENKLIKSGS